MEKTSGRDSQKPAEKPPRLQAGARQPSGSGMGKLRFRRTGGSSKARSVADPGSPGIDAIDDALLLKKMAVQLLLEDIEALLASVKNLPVSNGDIFKSIKLILRARKRIRDAVRKLKNPYSSGFGQEMHKAATFMETPCKFFSDLNSRMSLNDRERCSDIIGLALGSLNRIVGLAGQGTRLRSTEPVLAPKRVRIKPPVPSSSANNQPQAMPLPRPARQEISGRDTDVAQTADQADNSRDGSATDSSIAQTGTPRNPAPEPASGEKTPRDHSEETLTAETDVNHSPASRNAFLDQMLTDLDSPQWPVYESPPQSASDDPV